MKHKFLKMLTRFENLIIIERFLINQGSNYWYSSEQKAS